MAGFAPRYDCQEDVSLPWMKDRRRRELGLVWQAALVVLPVAVLSGVALHFLGQDRAAVETEARGKAQALAPALALRLGPAASAALARESAQFVAVQPFDRPELPVPADWPATLTPAHAQLWSAAQAAIYRRSDGPAARQALTTLRYSNASTDARANAELGLLSLAAKQTPVPALALQAVDLARRLPQAVTESGIAVAELALLLALEHAPLTAPLWTEVETRVRGHLTVLTPELLAATKRAAGDGAFARRVQDLAAFSVEREQNRAALRAALVSGECAAGRELWFAAADRSVLALCEAAGTVRLIPAPLFEKALHAALPERPADLPPYAAATLEMGGRATVIAGALRDAGPRILATATGKLLDRDFALHVVLGDSGLLYGAYRRQLRLTQAVIFCAAAAALIGLISLWNGYRRQIRLSEMQSNFVSSVSHELRAPIAAVQLMAESLDGGRVADPTRQKDYFHLIAQECRRLSSLVENVLDFSRIDEGRKRYSFEPVALLPLLRHTVSLMEPCAVERGVRLALTEPGPEAAAAEPRWDGAAVEQSLVNLLDNAIKHSPPGAAVKVAVELAPPWIRLWIEDCGPGIPKEEHARIFDLFYRHGSELRRETKGVGIGLSIVKHVAEAHGGRVIVESEVGRGSRFALELPWGAQI